MILYIWNAYSRIVAVVANSLEQAQDKAIRELYYYHEETFYEKPDKDYADDYDRMIYGNEPDIVRECPCAVHINIG